MEKRAKVVEKEPLKDEVNAILEEARMVLPGIQALFGFQLVAVFNARFEHLTPALQMTHLVALVSVAISVSLVMTPRRIIALPNEVAFRRTSRNWRRG